MRRSQTSLYPPALVLCHPPTYSARDHPPPSLVNAPPALPCVLDPCVPTHPHARTAPQGLSAPTVRQATCCHPCDHAPVPQATCCGLAGCTRPHCHLGLPAATLGMCRRPSTSCPPTLMRHPLSSSRPSVHLSTHLHVRLLNHPVHAGHPTCPPTLTYHPLSSYYPCPLRPPTNVCCLDAGLHPSPDHDARPSISPVTDHRLPPCSICAPGQAQRLKLTRRTQRRVCHTCGVASITRGASVRRGLNAARSSLHPFSVSCPSPLPRTPHLRC